MQTFRTRFNESLCMPTAKTLPILDAAHIQPYAEGGEHSVTNGLLLRTDIHRLFDLGYVTVSSGGRFEVGRRLREDFENGHHYYAMHGQQLSLPLDARQHPARERPAVSKASAVPPSMSLVLSCFAQFHV